MDEELILACQTKFEEDEDERITLEEKRRMKWERLEAAAAGQPVTGNTAVLVTPFATPAISATLVQLSCFDIAPYFYVPFLTGIWCEDTVGVVSKAIKMQSKQFSLGFLYYSFGVRVIALIMFDLCS